MALALFWRCLFGDRLEIVKNKAPKRTCLLKKAKSPSPESYLDNVLALPGFQKWTDDIMALRDRLNVWEKQGVAFHKKCSAMHALVIHNQHNSALDFAKLYHSFLGASKFFAEGARLGIFDAHKICLSPFHDDVCCLDFKQFKQGTLVVTNLSKLCGVARQRLSSILNEQQNIVMIAICSQASDLKYLSVTETRFSVTFNRFQTPIGDPIQKILQLVELKLKEDYNGNMKLDGGITGPHARVLARRAAKQLEKGDKSMEDIVQDSLNAIMTRQTNRNLTQNQNERLNSQPDLFWISKDDIIGPEPDRRNIRSRAWTELQEMVGLEEVKSSVAAFLDGRLVDYHRELNGKDHLRTGLSRLFVGPPGTGKTTVAKLYGQILCDFGVLASGELIVKNATDFIGNRTGDSEKSTKRYIKEAGGKVLLIDEAYMLNPMRSQSSHPCPLRQAVVDTIVGEIQNTADDNICVILCGYKEEMEKLLLDANPGLARRFPMADAFEFRNFDDSQLEKVLDLKLKKEDLGITAEARAVALDALRQARQRPNFGNGGEIVNLLARATQRYRKRFPNMPASNRNGEICFEVEDFDARYASGIRAEDQIDDIFVDLIGLDDYISSFKSLARQASAIRKLGRDPKAYLPFQYVFKGPPGSGKSLVARKMGRLYRLLGLLPTDDIVEVSAQDMISEYVGGTPTKTRKLLEKALGKVLVVDGAHRLASDASKRHDFEKEARDELIGAITSPRFANNILIIIAGHDNGIDKIMSLHPGLRSLFRKELVFTGLAAHDSVVLLMARIRAYGVGLVIDSEQEAIEQVLQILTSRHGWGNGHDIEAIAKDVATQCLEDFSLNSTNAPLATGSQILRILDDRIPSNVRARAKHPESSSADEPIVPRRVQDLEVNTIHPAVQFSTVWASKYKTLPEGRFTRIIRLQPADNLEAPVECTLECFCLDDKSIRYDALSYVWGTPVLSKEIKCDSQIMRVTSNCEVALRHLRHNTKPRLLWVDAICIDQQSVTEKNHQVPLMGAIYSSAAQVLVWLGRGSPDIQEGLRRFQRLSCLKEGDWRRFPTVRAIIFNKYYLPTDDTLLQPLLLSQWWRRMWTLQEIALARRPIIVVGKTLIPFYDFLKRFADLFETSGHDLAKSYRKMLLSHKPSLSIPGFGSTLLPSWLNLLKERPTMPAFGLVPDTRFLFIFLDNFWRATERGVLLEDLKEEIDSTVIIFAVSCLLHMGRNRGASDPKDKIYGLHHMLSAISSDIPAVDYSGNVAEIYRSFTYAFIEQSGSFWIFEHLHGGKGCVPGLPSWVPDFSAPVFRGAMGLDVSSTPTFSDTMPLAPVAVTHHQGLLRCSSLFCWTIVDVAPWNGPKFEPEYNDASVLCTSALESWLDAEAEILSCLINWLQWIESSISDHLSYSRDISLSPLQKDRLRYQADLALTDTLLGQTMRHNKNKNPEGEDDIWGKPGFLTETNIKRLQTLSRLLRACMSPDLGNPCPECLCTESESHKVDGPLHCIKSFLDQGPGFSTMISLLYANASGKYLFRTAAAGNCPGHFGLTLAQPKVGDSIAQFTGADSPTILRQALLPSAGGPEIYKVVGQATGIGVIATGSLFEKTCSGYPGKHDSRRCSEVMAKNDVREIVLW